MNSDEGKRCPDYTFSITAEAYNDVKDRRPDLCVYRKDTDEIHYKKGDKTFANLGYAHMFIEVKSNSRQDYFNDPPADESIDRSKHRFVLKFNRNTDAEKLAREDLGQIVAYATEACARQHRAACYSISVRGVHARLMRWDRSGAITTEAFNLRTHPQFLCEFLWRFSKCSDFQRGFDSTVTRASDADEENFKRVIQKHVQFQADLTIEDDKFKKAFETHYEPGKVYVVRAFEDPPSDVSHEYLVSRPVVSPLSIASRAMRGYWAVSREEGKIAFLKDTWRYDTEEQWKG